LDRFLDDDGDWHPGSRYQLGDYCKSVLIVWTDDPAEAEVAWERAERWVRTGVLDDG
jgi:hypothetical protein